MAKGLDKHKERIDILSSFGKDLTRRSSSKCELCSASGVSLNIFEVPPVQDIPDIEKCVFICNTCNEFILNPKLDPRGHWKCLNTPIWSEVPAIQVLSYKLLKQIEAKEKWVSELLEEVYLDPEIEEWAKS